MLPCFLTRPAGKPKTQLHLDFESQMDYQFEKYHYENPIIYEQFKKFALQVKESGKQRYGAKAVFERIRWFFDIETKGDTFKINNNYVSRYVRKLIKEMPEFNDFFATRELRS